MKSAGLLTFLVVESVVTLAWWVLLLAMPSARHYFLPSFWPDSVLLSFALGDLSLIVGGGLVAAVGVRRRAVWGRFALGLHTGAVAYAALYTIAAWMATRQAGVAALLMSADAVALALLTAVYLRAPQSQ